MKVFNRVDEDVLYAGVLIFLWNAAYLTGKGFTLRLEREDR
jgi:hypothetical protein